MARNYQPSAATQRKTPTTPPGPDPFDAQDQRAETGQVGGNTERRENLTAVQDQPDNDRGDFRATPGDREFGKDRDERKQHEGFTERGSWSVQPPTPPVGVDVFTPVLEAWKQVFKSWSELAQTMVKAQQDVFAGMISAADTTARNINVGDRPDAEFAFSGAHTTASADRIERNRR
jgi:hypothetical protein